MLFPFLINTEKEESQVDSFRLEQLKNKWAALPPSDWN